MIFFSKPSTIHVDCFTYNEMALLTAPIERASRYMPEWFKTLSASIDIPNVVFPAPTMKYCAGVVDYYAKSIGLPLWSDLAIKIENREYYWKYSDSESIAMLHDKLQYPGYLEGSNYGHLKLMSPWSIQTKEDTAWMFSQPLYNYNTVRDFSVLPGVINFKHQPATHVQMMIDLSKDKKFVIPLGELLANITPLTDKKIKLHRHLVTIEEFKRIDRRKSLPVTFIDKYKTLIKRKKEFSDCPYTNRTKDYSK